MSPILAKGCAEPCPAAAGLAAGWAGGCAGSRGIAWTKVTVVEPYPWDGKQGLWKSCFNFALMTIAVLQPAVSASAALPHRGFASPQTGARLSPTARARAVARRGEPPSSQAN